VRFATVRAFALTLPEVTEAPHHHFGSFRVGGKIFATVPPGDEIIHVFVAEPDREVALALYPEFVEKLWWGAKVVGLRVHLPKANLSVVKGLVRTAWQAKAGKLGKAA
jgi:hypothetical protein